MSYKNLIGRKAGWKRAFFVEAKKTMSIFVYIYVRQSASKDEQAQRKETKESSRVGYVVEALEAVEAFV